MKDNANRYKIKVISFFSGCGGLDLGILGNFTYKDKQIKRTPFSIIAAYDNNDKCVETYKRNISTRINKLDLSTADTKKMPKADVIIGGFPCQDFSTCGTQAGLKSKRGKLYKSMLDYLKAHKPYLMIAENVSNLAQMNNGKIIKKILNEINNIGYKTIVWNLNAYDYGVPQSRNRIFIIGIRNDLKGYPIKPRPLSKVYRKCIEWAINDLIKIKDESIPNQSQYFKAKKARQGNGQGDETNKIGEPAYTIRANSKSRIQFHYSLKRRLTVRECARIQTFPDKFIFPHSTTTNIMQIGNAVPPVLANIIACSISEFIKKRVMNLNTA